MSRMRSEVIIVVVRIISSYNHLHYFSGSEGEDDSLIIPSQRFYITIDNGTMKRLPSVVLLIEISQATMITTMSTNMSWRWYGCRWRGHGTRTRFTNADVHLRQRYIDIDSSANTDLSK